MVEEYDIEELLKYENFNWGECSDIDRRKIYIVETKNIHLQNEKKDLDYNSELTL
jgi:hypothetical protein